MTGTMVSLTRSDEERELIQESLEEPHRTLRMEISHTDHHHFQKGAAEEGGGTGVGAQPVPGERLELGVCWEQWKQPGVARPVRV